MRVNQDDSGGGQNVPHQKLQKTLDLNPVKLSPELPAFQLSHKSKLHGPTLLLCSSLQKLTLHLLIMDSLGAVNLHEPHHAFQL